MKPLFRFAAIFLLLASCSDAPETPTNDSLADTASPASVHAPADTLDTIYHFNSPSEVVMAINSKGKLIEKKVFELQKDSFFDANGKLKYLIDGPSPDSESKHYSYYSNGKRKRVSEQGIPFGCGMPVGEELQYDSLGNLLARLTYDNYIPDGVSGCHQTATVISTVEYYPGNIIKLKKQVKTSYEAGAEYPCGTWEYYNEQGKLVKKEKYGPCK